jgi:hypothetical protein
LLLERKGDLALFHLVEIVNQLQHLGLTRPYLSGQFEQQKLQMN